MDCDQLDGDEDSFARSLEEGLDKSQEDVVADGDEDSFARSLEEGLDKSQEDVVADGDEDSFARSLEEGLDADDDDSFARSLEEGLEEESLVDKSEDNVNVWDLLLADADNDDSFESEGLIDKTQVDSFARSLEQIILHKDAKGKAPAADIVEEEEESENRPSCRKRKAADREGRTEKKKCQRTPTPPTTVRRPFAKWELDKTNRYLGDILSTHQYEWQGAALLASTSSSCRGACSSPIACRACSSPIASRACSSPIASRACSSPISSSSSSSSVNEQQQESEDDDEMQRELDLQFAAVAATKTKTKKGGSKKKATTIKRSKSEKEALIPTLRKCTPPCARDPLCHSRRTVYLEFNGNNTRYRCESCAHIVGKKLARFQCTVETALRFKA